MEDGRERTNICLMALRFCSRNQDKSRSCQSSTRSRNSKSKRMAHRLRSDALMAGAAISPQKIGTNRFTARRSDFFWKKDLKGGNCSLLAPHPAPAKYYF